MGKNIEQGTPEESDRFEDLRRRREEAEAEREATFRRQVAEFRPGLETKRAITLASYSKWLHLTCMIEDPEDQPIGIESHFESRIVISDEHWAKRIVQAALLWRVCPGFDALKERPIPDTGPGFDAGERIFGAAGKGASVERVAELLRCAREALGTWKGLGSRQPHAECDLGLWGYFKQIDRFFDGRSWAPPPRPKPRSPRTKPTPSANVAPAVPASPDIVPARIVISIDSDRKATVSKGPYTAHIGGPTQVKMLRLVTGQHHHFHRWQDIIHAWLQEDGVAVAAGRKRRRAILSAETLARSGRRIRGSLGELACYWKQDGHGVSWEPPGLGTVRTDSTDTSR